MVRRNGSQIFFWLTEASVEMMPKLSSVGACAMAARPDDASATAVTVHESNLRNIFRLPLSLATASVECMGFGALCALEVVEEPLRGRASPGGGQLRHGLTRIRIRGTKRRHARARQRGLRVTHRDACLIE